jgi:hypothetical protein
MLPDRSFPERRPENGDVVLEIKLFGSWIARVDLEPV